MKYLFKNLISISLFIIIALSAQFLFTQSVDAASEPFVSWTVSKNNFPDSKSDSNYKYYYTNINPFVNGGYGLPNCTCYAFGRAYEVLGYKPNLSYGNASQWYDYNINNKVFKYGTEPKAGAIACWSGGNEYGDGHVAFIEKVEGSKITLSESAWSWRSDDSIDYDMRIVEIEDYQINKLHGSRYVFQGYIYLFGDAPIVDKELWVMDYAVNVRESYSTSSAIIDTYAKGTSVRISEYKSSGGYFWGRVGTNAWCVLDYCHYVSGTNTSGYYGVSYNLNGGEYNGNDYMTGTLKKKRTNIKVTTRVPTRQGYNFMGWTTSPDSSTVKYKSGSTYKTDNSITLYAVWQKVFNISEDTFMLDLSGVSSKILNYKINTDKKHKINFARSDKTVAECIFITKDNQIVVNGLGTGSCTVTIGLYDEQNNKLDLRSFKVIVYDSRANLNKSDIFKSVYVKNLSQYGATVLTNLNKSYQITEYGVYYGQTKDTLHTLKSTKTQTKNSLSISWPDGLKPNTKYYVRFYFVYNGKKYQSYLQSFTTMSNLKSLQVKKLPQTVYTIGDKMNDSNMILLAKSDSGRGEYIVGSSACKVSGFNTSLAGNKTVKLTYKGVSTSYIIDVNCPTPSTPVITEIRNTTTGIKVTWKETKNANMYRIYRRVKGDTAWTKLADRTLTYYNDKSAKNGVQYEYAVRGCYTSNSESQWGKPSSVVTCLSVTTPVASLASTTYNSIKINWSEVKGASRYYIYRKAEGEKSYTKIAYVTGQSSTSYTDTKTSCSKNYTYAVRAYNKGYLSSFSGRTFTCIPAAPKLNKAEYTNNTLTVSFSGVSGATNYVVYVKKSGDSSYSRLAVTDKTNFSTKDVKKGETYTVMVRCYRRVNGKNIYSAASNKIKIVCQ